MGSNAKEIDEAGSSLFFSFYFSLLSFFESTSPFSFYAISDLNWTQIKQLWHNLLNERKKQLQWINLKRFFALFFLISFILSFFFSFLSPFLN